MSIQGIRKLSQSQRIIIDQTWRNIFPLMKAQGEQYSQVLSWSNMYLNNKFKVDFPNKLEWLQFTKKITEQICPKEHILTTGFVYNPANTQKNQHWHNDYGTNVNTIFIPLVDQGCQTATQIMNYSFKSPGKLSDLGYQSNYGNDALDIMDRQGLEFLTVSQIICRSHTILKMNGGSVHRGIANKSNTDRVLFYICCSAQKTSLNQEQFVQTNMIPKNK